ncbi:hypothetical protein ACSBR2_026723 [Camellia fascicularis]
MADRCDASSLSRRYSSAPRANSVKRLLPPAIGNMCVWGWYLSGLKSRTFNGSSSGSTSGSNSASRPTSRSAAGSTTLGTGGNTGGVTGRAPSCGTSFVIWKRARNIPQICNQGFRI